MGCTLDHTLVDFSITKQYTECIFLIEEVSLHFALQTFEDVNEGYLNYIPHYSLKIHVKHYPPHVSLIENLIFDRSIGHEKVQSTKLIKTKFWMCK